MFTIIRVFPYKVINNKVTKIDLERVKATFPVKAIRFKGSDLEIAIEGKVDLESFKEIWSQVLEVRNNKRLSTRGGWDFSVSNAERNTMIKEGNVKAVVQFKTKAFHGTHYEAVTVSRKSAKQWFWTIVISNSTGNVTINNELYGFHKTFTTQDHSIEHLAHLTIQCFNELTNNEYA